MDAQNGTTSTSVAASGGHLRTPVEPPCVPGDTWMGGVEVRLAHHDGERVGFFVPAQSGRRRTGYSGEQARLLRDLQLLQFQAVELDRSIGQAVRQGRDLGISWAVLGFSTGLTDNGAKSRWGVAPAVPGEVL